jgi:radical SAM protein with 4Fe4S-binding SPASM domain
MTDKLPVLDKMVDLGHRLYPTSAFFELTHACNGSCGYCYIQDKTESKDLDTASVFLALDKLYDAGVMNVVFTGGEIFMRRDILAILRYAVAKDFWFLGLLTNGTLLTKQYMDFVILNKDRFARTMSMSVFSHIPEVNDAYFGIPDALEKICRNGEYLIQRGIYVNVKLNVMEFNIDTFLDTCDFFKEKGFSVSHSAGVMLSAGRSSLALKKYSEKEFISNYLKKLPVAEIETRKNEFLKRVSSETPGDLCRGRQTSLCIENTGRIKPCVGFVHSDGSSILDQGTLRELLLRSEAMTNVRNHFKADIPKCRECRFLHYCTPCLAEMDAEHGSISFPPTKACSLAEALNEL